MAVGGSAFEQLVVGQAADLCARQEIARDVDFESVTGEKRRRERWRDEEAGPDDEAPPEDSPYPAGGRRTHADVVARLRRLAVSEEQKDEEDEKKEDESELDALVRQRLARLTLGVGSSIVAELHGTKTVYNMMSLIKDYFFQPEEVGGSRELVAPLSRSDAGWERRPVHLTCAVFPQGGKRKLMQWTRFQQRVQRMCIASAFPFIYGEDDWWVRLSIAVAIAAVAIATIAAIAAITAIAFHTSDTSADSPPRHRRGRYHEGILAHFAIDPADFRKWVLSIMKRRGGKTVSYMAVAVARLYFLPDDRIVIEALGQKVSSNTLDEYLRPNFEALPGGKELVLKSTCDEVGE
jgi:hypothetical protein